jgi:hypothetical protein
MIGKIGVHLGDASRQGGSSVRYGLIKLRF